MNKREYLRSQGFKVGERGRFTPEMMTALKGFNETSEVPPRVLDVEVYDPPVVFRLPEEPLMREPRTLYGYTREGYRVGFVLCQSCTKHMMFCSCHKGITAPTIVVRSDEKEVHVRTKVS